MGVVIKVENVGKSYIIKHQGQSEYTALRDVIADNAKAMFRSAGNIVKRSPPKIINKKETFWALNQVNLTVNKGDRIGIIGRNGAGKSTLLKVLSRITEPTIGKISIKGRVASLLEVGTGFHPELTGRENIFLNGAILGMHRSEIKKKFDTIVDFSGVEKFLDTPVKRYSSGMYIRLAFAVAANLESDILVIDEVLAVGDAEFQKKCLGKMQDVSNKEGRTVLFVSHNTQAITNLCNQVALVRNGTIVQVDETAKVIRSYLMEETSREGEVIWVNENRPGDSNIKLNAIRILDQSNQICNNYGSKSKIKVQIDFDLFTLDNALVIGFDITNEDGIILLRTYHNDNKPEDWPKFQLGQNSIYCEIPGELFNNGTYYICPKISLHRIKWILNGDPLLSFDVDLNHGVSPLWTSYDKVNRPGFLAMIIPWKIS